MGLIDGVVGGRGHGRPSERYIGESSLFLAFLILALIPPVVVNFRCPNPLPIKSTTSMLMTAGRSLRVDYCGDEEKVLQISPITAFNCSEL